MKFSWRVVLFEPIGGALLFVILSGWYAYVLSLLHPLFALFGLILLYIVAFFLISALKDIRTMLLILKQDSIENVLGRFIALLIVIPIYFTYISFALELSIPGSFSSSIGQEILASQWFMFGFYNFAECILFDMPSIYRVFLPSIYPDTFIAKTTVLIFRLTMGLMVITAGLNIFQYFRKHSK